ncbi:MAG: hypothetical protein FWD60_11170, partial [Candidatus Azobacteroides sp.]|nr:hypothetical protein [Candidatus Azobacteroides sp.]
MKHNWYKKALTVFLIVLPLLSLQAQIGTPISSYNDLNTLVRLDLAGVYYLTTDIVIPDGTEWLPLGKPNNWNGNSASLANFTGLLDGRGFAIKNLKITTGADFSGLFARIVNGDIKNLRLENV